MCGDFELATLLLEAKANPIGVCTEDGDGKCQSRIPPLIAAVCCPLRSNSRSYHVRVGWTVTGLMLLVTNAMVQGDCQKSGFNVLQCLLDHDCDIDEQNSDGHCALLCACAAGNMEVIQFLLDNGASASVVNKCGHSAMDVAEGFGYTEVGAMLQKAAVAAA